MRAASANGSSSPCSMPASGSTRPSSRVPPRSSPPDCSRVGRGLATDAGPRDLDVRDAAAQHEARDGDHRPVLVDRGPACDERHAAGGTGERDRHELGEPARLVLDGAEAAQVRDALFGGLDVPVEDHARGAEAGAMSGRDPLDPAVDLEVARRDEGAHALAQHLHPGARHGVDTGVAERRECAVESETAAVGEVPDILRAVRVQMDARRRGLDRAGDVEVCPRRLRRRRSGPARRARSRPGPRRRRRSHRRHRA